MKYTLSTILRGGACAAAILAMSSCAAVSVAGKATDFAADQVGNLQRTLQGVFGYDASSVSDAYHFSAACEALASTCVGYDEASHSRKQAAIDLHALEALLQGHDVAGAPEIEQMVADWRRAYLETPHGNPVRLVRPFLFLSRQVTINNDMYNHSNIRPRPSPMTSTHRYCTSFCIMFVRRESFPWTPAALLLCI